MERISPTVWGCLGNGVIVLGIRPNYQLYENSFRQGSGVDSVSFYTDIPASIP